MRRILLILAVVAALALIAVTLWEQRSGPVTQGDPWVHVPNNALLVLEVPDPLQAWSKLAGTSQLWQSLTAIPSIAAFTTLIDDASRQWHDAPRWEAALEQSTMLIVMHEAKGMNVGASIVIGMPSNIKADDMEQILSCVFPSIGSAASLEAWTQLTAKGSTLKWNVRSSNNVLVISTEEPSSKQVPWIDHQTLTRLRSTFGGGADAHMILSENGDMKFLAPFLNDQVKKKLKAPSGHVAADLQIRPSNLLLSGIFLPDSSATYLNALGGNTDQRPAALSLLPKEVDQLNLLRFSDTRALLEARTNATKKDLPTIKAINDAIGGDLLDLLTSWVDGEIVIARNTTSDNAWVVINTYQSIAARAALLRFSNDGTTIPHRDLEIMEFNDPRAFAIAYGVPDGTEMTYGVVLSNAVVLSTSLQGAKAAINAQADANSLLMDQRAAQELESMPVSARLFEWTDVARSSAHFIHALDVPDTSSALRSVLSSIGGASIAILQHKGGLHYITASIHHAPMETQGSNILWATELPAPAARRPDLLIDHYTKTKEALVQLTDNSIVLVSSTGKVLWQAPLDGPILGEVVQVDRYKNGKLQMLFNTANKLYLVDRNGNSVEGFPVTVDATAPLALFDYDNDKKLRILVPGDNTLRNFDIAGKEVNGWKRPQVGKVKRPVRHLRIRSKDHLMAVDVDGRIHVLDRQGNERYNAQLTVKDASAHDLDVLPGTTIGDTKVLWVDTEGRSVRGQLDESSRVVTGSPTRIVGYTTMDMDGNGEGERVITSGSELLIHNGHGTKFNYAFDAPITSGPLPLTLSAQEKLIGLIVGEQVLLVDRLGRTVRGTPLAGNLPFRVADINLDGTFELITTAPDGKLVAYELEEN